MNKQSTRPIKVKMVPSGQVYILIKAHTELGSCLNQGLIQPHLKVCIHYNIQVQGHLIDIACNLYSNWCNLGVLFWATLLALSCEP